MGKLFRFRYLVISTFIAQLLLRTYCGEFSTCCVNITVAVLVERSAVLDFPFAINRTMGLINIAINHSRDIVKHAANLEFVVVPCDVPTCTALKWGALFAEVYHTYKPDAVIGPGCTPSVQTVSRMCVSWNLPHITYVGTAESLGNKKEYSTLSRLSYTMNVFAKFYVEVFNAFGWTNIANIYDSAAYLPNLVGTSLQRSFDEEALHINSYQMPFRSEATDLDLELRNTLKRATTKSRVFLVSCHGDILRSMALMARSVGLLAGEYIFIFFFQLHGDPPVGEYTWRRGDDLDEEAKVAYEAVMVIRPRRPITPEFDAFEKEVKDLALTEYNYTWRPNHEVSIYNIGQYDSFVLYSHALNETIAANENPRDGQKVVKRMWNRTFPGIGGLVYVNENGDRDTDFTLLDLDPVTGNFQVVAQYLGWTRQFEFITGVSIHWPRDKGAPPNVPKCGYTGELCLSFSLPSAAIVAICLSSVIVVVIISGVFVYRRLKAEAAMHSEWWKIRPDDIAMHTTSSFISSRSRMNDDGSLSLATHVACFQTIGLYKGTRVHIRKPKIKSFTVDQKHLLELKQMRDLACPNLTRLIGLCPEENNVCILTEHCSRGSLQDILQNESIQLDWDFRISLINDIVEGMHYLHSSPISVHGRLTSSRCVIDSRFVLKITGFGLRSIHDVHQRGHGRHVNTYSCMPELLWMAPEHVRVYPPRKSSQSGDVYSFAIILYEMCTRSEPYINEPWYRSTEETLNRIKAGGANPLRPDLHEDGAYPEVVQLAKCCWLEKEADRPNFTAVKKVLRRRRSRERDHISGNNVLDVLLHRMEQYANNLEGLVEERTQAFLDEKKKSEELLYQVLPRSVADQLRMGQSVHPEAYDGVTIYFSDIVGFTSISAQSTPFQPRSYKVNQFISKIVDFLNDLYTCFDRIIDFFDVYKVETIGDAYMVVSGLPERKDKEHVRHICRMALEILVSVRTFTIRHRPETPLKARIGIHSGPVCAGVVGRKMPRYCLFGDTVNTASRMESSGEAMKIHISKDTNDLLSEYGNFITEERGRIDIKGKGTMITYWLIDEVTTNYGMEFQA